MMLSLPLVCMRTSCKYSGTSPYSHLSPYYYKQLLDEVFMISGIIKPKPKAEADSTNRDLDYSGYHKNRI